MTTDSVVKILAVVGGGVVGGLGMGLLAQLLVRAFTTKKLPPWPVLTVRLLGGVICGWLVALWLFGGGGAGIGGIGGWGFGSGSGKGDGEKTTEVGKKDDKDKESNGEPTPPDATLRIEVLGKDTLKKADLDASRCYRVEIGERSRLLTMDEVKEAVRKRQEKEPPLRRLEFVLYKDSPDEQVGIVKELVRWSRDRNNGKMKVDILKPGTDAPMK